MLEDFLYAGPRDKIIYDGVRAFCLNERMDEEELRASINRSIRAKKRTAGKQMKEIESSVIASLIKLCANHTAYLVVGEAKNPWILPGLSCVDFRWERTLCSSSFSLRGLGRLLIARFRSLLSNSSGLYSGA